MTTNVVRSRVSFMHTACVSGSGVVTGYKLKLPKKWSASRPLSVKTPANIKKSSERLRRIICLTQKKLARQTNIWRASINRILKYDSDHISASCWLVGKGLRKSTLSKRTSPLLRKLRRELCTVLLKRQNTKNTLFTNEPDHYGQRKV